ncbi:alkanesulfonate monooxygenase SsuD/methylene tetrahydromethanopterin reductase-like flavin-dependent oxidoreductase (luciferase family) [Actinoalloteichus hoggarensis]|uniref:Phthiodiolone/phenolphthiodiolone dimycocerosates ketoreductase n=1 Tax=Actinoalloteichus hoggarensis TaxID=1470176 RepID=A0A221VYQ8_9PSEU|nr:LLM class flavin-dependent oxidoreductase [Actinoalloteichus hoggarensis]ASO18618.1 Phthiodiolone/phenolphthiodiolone dimycocerosates ketoreductase [Actinoalloteichus hoggarensis]MBB5921985.1 alkanesulfonate monooxygenase SsuD/methylene tetrahydromethanopterin reductase-like flavin-dependent oxidoreductase (luciferase family) [Actinoalloteichus hoggarensis]
MSTRRADIGMCFHRTFAPSKVTEFARRLEEGGADQLWLIEDCFYTAGVSLAAAALTVTERLKVGIGILPAVARNPAITAMEIATLCGLAPGRVLPGIGHGVQSWMRQMGVRPASPLTALEEVLSAVNRLLAGEEVTVDGRYVRLDRVALDQPPVPPPPLLAGVRGPKSLAVAGRAAGGVVLAEPTSPSYVRAAVEQAGSPADFHVVAFSFLCVEADRATAYRRMAPWLATQLADPSPGLTVLPFFQDLHDLFTRDGVDALVTMPPDWWRELGPVGTFDDAVAHVEALEDAGVRSIGLFPEADVEIASAQLETVLRLAAR